MKLSPVLFLVGKEPLQQKLFMEGVRKELFPNGSGGLNDDSFDLKETPLAEIFDLANTFPILANKRLIVVRNGAEPKESDESQWLNYFENPSPHTVLIAMWEKLDKRKRLFKLCEKAGAIITFEAPKPNEVSSWIDKLSARYEIKVSTNAKKMLVEALGKNLDVLDRELEKLSLYIHPEKILSENAIEDLILRTAGDNIFAFTDQVIEGRAKEAFETLDHLMSTGTPALVLLSMLARHLRILLKTYDHLKEKANRSDLAALLGVPPFLVQRYTEQAREFSSSNARLAMSELRHLDHDLKSSGLPAKFLFERSIRVISTMN